MTTAPTTIAALPAHERYEEAEQALSQVEELVELIRYALLPYKDASEDAAPKNVAAPTLADVGRLYSFVASVEFNTLQLQQEAADLRKLLYDVDTVRMGMGGESDA